MIEISLIPIHGSDTTWNGFDSVSTGAHFGVIPWDNTLASFIGTGVVANQHIPLEPNFIAHTNYLSEHISLTDVTFATAQDGVAMYLRNATAGVGNAFTFFTHEGPVVLTMHDIDTALGLGDPNLALGGFYNMGIEITGLPEFKDMLVTSGAHGFGVFADTSRDFNAVSGAPEMGTWTMLLCGFAMMGVAVLRRARTARALVE